MNRYVHTGRDLISIRTGHLRLLLISDDQPYYGTNAGNYSDGEEDTNADFLGQTHLHLVYNNDWDCQKGKIDADVDGAQGDDALVVVDIDMLYFSLAQTW